jgi:hypothetical protein
MDDKKIKEAQEKIANPELVLPEQEFTEQEKRAEQKENLSEDQRVSAELRREIELMELDEASKPGAEKAREKIEFLGEKEKVEHLLEMAREHGLVFAINVAKKMNDPYILDVLHDTLAQEGYYKDFTK